MTGSGCFPIGSGFDRTGGLGAGSALGGGATGAVGTGAGFSMTGEAGVGGRIAGVSTRGWAGSITGRAAGAGGEDRWRAGAGAVCTGARDVDVSGAEAVAIATFHLNGSACGANCIR